jgi:hypothetical protein
MGKKKIWRHFREIRVAPGKALMRTNIAENYRNAVDGVGAPGVSIETSVTGSPADRPVPSITER